METPSSTARRVTRSQTAITAGKSDNVSAIKKIDESRQKANNKQQDRSALIDITNDSPIVGLAMGKLETPSFLMSKNRANFSNQVKKDSTPGSGEALLRGQVKNLLQKVEEEAKISEFSSVPKVGGQFLNSQNGLLPSTPANTPQITSNPSAINGSVSSIAFGSILESQAENKMISLPQGEPKNDMMITRSLLLDFSEKSEGSYSSEGSSVVTYEEGEGKKQGATKKDKNSLIWSIQVNPSKKKDQENEEEEIEDEADNYFDEVEEENEDEGLVGELCEAISKIDVNGNGLQAKFCGKHIKFVYNSDDELEGEEVTAGASSDSPGSGGLRLQGWPTPKGKHIRFPEDIDD